MIISPTEFPVTVTLTDVQIPRTSATLRFFGVFRSPTEKEVFNLEDEERWFGKSLEWKPCLTVVTHTRLQWTFQGPLPGSVSSEDIDPGVSTSKFRKSTP